MGIERGFGAAEGDEAALRGRVVEAWGAREEAVLAEEAWRGG